MLRVLKMSERTVESRLVKGIKKLGGLCLKFTSPGNAGVPDRLIITATGRVLFAELKTETGRLSKIQEYTIGVMRQHNAEVWVLRGAKDVDLFLTVIQQRENEGWRSDTQ